jgi:hypothetical protein
VVEAESTGTSDCESIKGKATSRSPVRRLLSKDGQAVWVANAKQNSRRLDVAGPPDTAPDPKRKYRIVESEPLAHFKDESIALAKQTLA